MRAAPFVLLTKSRSGSKWLVELLDSHEQLAVYGELFGGDQVRVDYGARGFPKFGAYLAQDGRPRRRLPLEVSRVRYLHELFASQRDATAIGVKLVYPHATRAIHGYLSARRARVIHLIRSNLLDAALSYEVASARQVFGARVGEPLPPVTVRLDAATLRRRLGQHEYSINVARSRLLLYRLPTLEVFYEELVVHHEETVAGVLEFLGVDVSAEPLQSTFAPIDDLPRADVLANLDEVERVLAGTRFEWMLAPRAAVRESIS